ncbi:hypothetical protein F5B22DRAFT_607360 [Xylaria bambusicola]|uniref:uncharacterized protein n=1 Tax=Xylaria bambusicola TaxID=326684 RepID=UPI0020079BBB|nr:uncharacterized protein F5B22DRAFT_607360 [Xylaria bambusicola]KAI0515437.1 hypothetical protein F5B22DRAFT_607360 [Xylaria bambusicola]
MDDPWGSPWASTDNTSDNDPRSSSRADIFLSPPPKAFFGNGSASLSPQSPWSGNHNDGGLNIWTAGGPRADDADNQNEWSTWVDSTRLSPRLSGSGRESPLAWPENAAASPVFIANSRSRTPSILRHQSPDPWAVELPLSNKSDAELPDSIKGTANEALATESGQVGATSQAYQNIAGNHRAQITNSENALVDDEFTVRRNDSPRTSHELATEHANTGSQLDSVACELPSRPSSTCTTNSHDGPDRERQDSPITSIDEDRGGRIRNNSRKVSGKVQELVGIYDGLARAVSEEPPALSRRRMSQAIDREDSAMRGKSEDGNDDDGAGFGDFEDPLSDESIIAPSPSRSFSSGLSSTPKAEINNSFTQKLEGEAENDAVVVAETGPAQITRPLNQFKGMKFDANLSALDKLFPNASDQLTSCSTEGREVPGHVINDSFETVSERKAWYRISRFGSMRKHNSGDDENYHRVAWPASQLHTDTIKIVRKWMEQDTYAGKAILGGPKRTGFFDWDSDIAPVELDQVFQRKKSATQHTRTTSIPAPNAITPTRPVDERPYRNSTGISLPIVVQPASHPTTVVPSFDWNSGTQQASFTTQSSPTSSQKLGAEAVPVSVPAPVQTVVVDENDDDWGEMISSPRATQDYIEQNVTTFPLPEVASTNHELERPSSLTSSGNHQTTARNVPVPQGTPVVPDPWSLLDISVLDTNAPKLPRETSLVPGANTLPPNKDLFKLEDSTFKQEMLDQGMITDQTALKQSLKKETSPISIPGGGNHDDIVVQTILKHLPDLSYMFR